MVVCPHCRFESADDSYCDRCNRPLSRSTEPVLPGSVRLGDGRLIDCSGFRGAWPVDCWSPQHVGGDFPCRVYALDRSWWRDLADDVWRRAACSGAVLGPIHVVPLDEGAVVVAEALPDAGHPLLATTAGEDELATLEETLDACRLLTEALRPLHEAGLVWLNFDPAALEAAGGQVRITNLDLQVFPARACPDSLRLSAAYSPPEVCAFRPERIAEPGDVFHLALYAYYRLAGLLLAGFPGQGLEAFDFEIPPLRIYRPGLLPGVAPLLVRALARDPGDRFATPDEFLAAFEQAVERLGEPAPLACLKMHCECGAATAIGRSHELIGLPNQDGHTMLSLSRDRALFVVADGVTSARIGSGDLASEIGVESLAGELARRLLGATGAAQVEAALAEAFLVASNAILQRSLQEGVPPGTDPADLMCSTALVGYAHGDLLTLASAGDSRAFLVRDGQAEQLTVDGDVGCAYLAAGAAPEAVSELGPDALALYSCLGVGKPGPDGRLVCWRERSLPRVNHWRVRPGDVVVLATDGLVEEGVFLEPADLAGLVGAAPLSLPAEELARRLVAAALARHREPSPWEPFGCGDDVTCVVLIWQPVS